MNGYFWDGGYCIDRYMFKHIKSMLLILLHIINKRPMGHMAHLRNQFKSMNTNEQSYDYIYYKIGPVVREEKIFKFHECTFSISLIPTYVKRCHLSI